MTFRNVISLCVVAANIAVAAGCSPSDVTTYAAPVAAVPATPVPDSARREWFTWSPSEGVLEISSPPGVLHVSPADINGKGDVVGTMLVDYAAGMSPAWHAFIWSEARGYVDLGAPIGAIATSIDEAGTVVGYYYVGSAKEAFVWTEKNGLKPLQIRIPFLGGIVVAFGHVAGNALTVSTNLNSYAAPYRLDLALGHYDELAFSSDVGGSVNDINAKGEAVGYDGYLDHGFGGSADAVIWNEAGQKTTAMSCGTEWNCFAYLTAINDKGVAVGTVRRDYGVVRVFRWSRDAGVEFVDLPGGSTEEDGAAGITDDGSVLVFSRRTGFVIRANGAIDNLAAAFNGGLFPVAINRSGKVVGRLF